MPAPKTNNPDGDALLSRLAADFPSLSFRSGRRFAFRPPRTILYDPADPNLPLLILHELGHATIAKNSYQTDVARLRIERAAWDQAAKYCAKYDVPYDADFVEQLLDTYRDWLHSKSRCPRCGLTRYQTKSGKYICPGCKD